MLLSEKAGRSRHYEGGERKLDRSRQMVCGLVASRLADARQ
jgi:hypothetical protein